MCSGLYVIVIPLSNEVLVNAPKQVGDKKHKIKIPWQEIKVY